MLGISTCLSAKSGEALNNSSLNYQSKGNIKCDFLFPFIFNRLRRMALNLSRYGLLLEEMWAARPCTAETLN
jgi:hypothetical protein